MFYRALPLGYHLKYMDLSIDGSCPWCPEEQQTVDHFIIQCKASKEAWNKAYTFLQTGIQETPPSSIKEVFDISNIKG